MEKNMEDEMDNSLIQRIYKLWQQEDPTAGYMQRPLVRMLSTKACLLYSLLPSRCTNKLLLRRKWLGLAGLALLADRSLDKKARLMFMVKLLPLI